MLKGESRLDDSGYKNASDFLLCLLNLSAQSNVSFMFLLLFLTPLTSTFPVVNILGLVFAQNVVIVPLGSVLSLNFHNRQALGYVLS